MQSILVTGGAGFIGANFVHFPITETDVQIINLDKLSLRRQSGYPGPVAGQGYIRLR